MRHPPFFLILAVLVVGFCVSPVLAQGETQSPAPATIEGGFWAILNSPVGMSVVSFFLMLLLGKVFTAKPKWRKYVDKYRPLLISAVKHAERIIPDTTSSPGLRRLDLALKYALHLNAKLDKDTLRTALTEVHSELEAAGNLSKPKLREE